MHMDIWIKLMENLKFKTNIEPFKVDCFETVIRLKPTLGSESNDKLHTEKSSAAEACFLTVASRSSAR